MYAVILSKKDRKVLINVVEDYNEALYIVKELFDFIADEVLICIKKIEGERK